MNLLEKLKEKKQAVLYGAQIYATSIYGALKECYPNLRILCFLVTKAEGNPETIDGIPVLEVRTASSDIKRETVLIATPEFYHREIAGVLDDMGFNDAEMVNDTDLSELLSIFYKKRSRRQNWTFLAFLSKGLRTSLDNSDNVQNINQDLIAYQACSTFDRPLAETVDIPQWIYPVQAGSALSCKRICELQDNNGAHISDKNRNFCELTVAYWIWKNRLKDSEYIGICHYRRFLDIDPDIISRLKEQEIEAILPFPMLVYPTAWMHHTRFVQDKDWERMIKIIEEKYPEYYEAAQGIWDGQEFYLHNIWILRRDCAAGFLEWMFDILFEIERRWECSEEKREDRHMGYLGENLTTLYFMYHRKDMRIAHVPERILM